MTTFLNNFLVHPEQRFPPYGLSGLLLDFGNFLISEGITLGTPDKGFLQILHFATFVFSAL